MRIARSCSLAAILLACASLQSFAQSTAAGSVADAAADVQLTRINTSAVIAGNQPILIDNPYGDVRLRFGGYDHAVEVHAVVQQPAGASNMDLKPGTVDNQYRIAPRLPEGTRMAEGQRLDLVVFIAEGHAVNVRTEQGLIESRGIRADINLHSASGDIAIRGTQGTIQARTGPGSIEASLGPAPSGSTQRLATSTGTITLALDNKLDAHLELSTSAAFATEFSLQIDPLPGQEPNKKARAVVGADKASIIVESLRGEIRLLRWTGFTSADQDPVDEKEVESDSD